jgi:hypothetical protein
MEVPEQQQRLITEATATIAEALLGAVRILKSMSEEAPQRKGPARAGRVVEMTKRAAGA